MRIALLALVVLAVAYALAAPVLRISALRAERGGDEERGQRLRLLSFQLRMGLVGLILVAVAVTVVRAVR